MNWQATLIGALLAAALGFGVGYRTKGKFDQAAEVTQVRKDAKQTASNVVEATQRSVALDTAVAADSAQIDHIKEAAAARVAKYQPKPEQHNEQRVNPGSLDGIYGQQPAYQPPSATGESLAQVGCRSNGLVLDVGTVRLLNSAAEGADLDSTGRGDGEKPAVAGAAR